MRDEDPPLACGERQDFRIVESFEMRDLRGAEIHAGGATHQCRHDDLIEVGVRLEADHRQEAMSVRRAAASFW